MGNLVSCVEDNIFNPVESEIVPPSVHVQEEKYRLACEHHQTQVAALASVQKEVNALKNVKKKVSTKIAEFVGKPTSRKRKLKALERCKLHLAEALEIKAEAKFELDEALKIQNEWVEKEKVRRKELSKVIEAEKERRREEEERLRVQKRLDAERAALEKEERLRQLREERHSKEFTLNNGVVQQVAPIHPRNSKRIDAELAMFLEEAENVILDGGGAANETPGEDQEESPLPSPPEPQASSRNAVPPASPGDSGSTMASPSKVPENLEASSPLDTASSTQDVSQQSPKLSPRDETKAPDSNPWRKPSKPKLDLAPGNLDGDIAQVPKEVPAE